MGADDRRDDDTAFSVSRRTLRRAAFVTGLVVVIAAVGVGAYLLGRSNTTSAGQHEASAAASQRAPRHREAAGSTATRASTTTTAPLPSTTTTTVPPTTTTTVPAAPVLAPASTPPVVGECSEPITIGVNGNASPLTCGSDVNVTAWNWFAASYPGLLSLGPTVSEGAVIATVCGEAGVFEDAYSAATIAAAYYGWPFSLPSELSWGEDSSAYCSS